MIKFTQKNSLLFLFLLLLFPLVSGRLQATEAEVFLYPEKIHPNEIAYLVIRTTGKKPDRNKLPSVKDLRWIPNAVRTSSQVNIINGKMTSLYENHIPFTVSKKGKYSIPLSGIINTEKSGRKQITFEAEERVLRTAEERAKDEKEKQNITLEEAIFSDMTVGSKKKKFYAGEEIPLAVNLYILQNLNGRPTSYPRISFGENNAAVFRDYSKINPENANFGRITRSVKKVGSLTYSVLTFHTRFTPIAAGSMQIRCVLPAVLLIPDDRRNTGRRGGFFDDDDFFGSFFSRERQIQRSLQSKEDLEILPRPPVPENAFFTGLTGSWKGEITLSPPPYKVGVPINLKIRYTGEGSLDFIKAPPLSPAGFRCYPPEVEKGNTYAEIRYVLIPTATSDGKQENLLLPPLAVLDPATGKYKILEYAQKLMIEKGTNLLPDNRKLLVVDGKKNTGKNGNESMYGEDEEEARLQADDVLYLKDLSHADPVRIPLWKNHFLFCMVLLFSGLLLLLVSAWIAFLKKLRENDPLFQRRKKANLLRKKLISDLSGLPAEELCTQSGRIAEVLAGLTGLAPGADLKECASLIEKEDKEFSGQLEKIASAAWMPSAKVQLDENFRRKFLKNFSSFTYLLFFAFLLFFNGELSGQEKKTVLLSSNAKEAAKAYDAGNFTAAENYYRKRLKEGHYSAAVLYNLGNTLYRKGLLADSLVCYEQALRLAPRDPDILENLNLLRRKLSLPEKGSVDSPADILPVLRDHLRPDEWLCTASAGFFLICIGLALWMLRKGADHLFSRIFTVAGLCILLLSLCAYFSQQKSSYSRKNVIITGENVKAYCLPSEKSAVLSLKFRNGEELSAEEKRQDFIRVRSGNAEGWIPVKSVKFLQTDIR